MAGRWCSASDDRYRGGPDRPFTREELHAKFTDCAQLVLSPARMKEALAQIESIDTLKDIRQLATTLSAVEPGAARPAEASCRAEVASGRRLRRPRWADRNGRRSEAL